MYIPVFFGIDVYSDLPVFIENFYKMVCFCIENKFPIIAQDRYFENPEIYGKLFSLECSEYIHQHKHVTFDMLKSIKSYRISDDVDKTIINKNKNIDNAWINLMNERQNVLEQRLFEIFEQIKKDFKKNIKSLIVFRHNASISYVANKLKIPVIELEFSTFRLPEYKEVFLYFQFSNKYTTNEFDKRITNFMKEYKENQKDVQLLNRKEILNIVLADKNKHYIDKIDNLSEYDFGVALGLQKDYEAKSMNCILNEDLISKISKLCEDNEILLRMHPSGISKNYKLPSNYIIDQSKNSIEFILKSRRIVSVLSNIGFEAMLYGKTSYVLGDMPFKKIAISSLDYIDEKIVGLLELNYIIFGFFVPYELSFDVKYLDFRLSNPTEIEIYLYHYNYILNKNNHNYKVKKILNTRSLYLKNQNELKKLIYAINNNMLKIEKLEKDNIDLKNDINFYKQKLLSIENSRSWKITKPLRKMVNSLSKVLNSKK